MSLPTSFKPYIIPTSISPAVIPATDIPIYGLRPEIKTLLQTYTSSPREVLTTDYIQSKNCDQLTRTFTDVSEWRDYVDRAKRLKELENKKLLSYIDNALYNRLIMPACTGIKQELERQRLERSTALMRIPYVTVKPSKPMEFKSFETPTGKVYYWE